MTSAGRRLLAVVVLLTWLLLHVSEASSLTVCTTATAALDTRELQMLSLINNARAALALPPYRPSPTLNRAAAFMAEWQVANNTLSHYDTAAGYQRDPFTRMHDCGHPTYGNAEDAGGVSPDPTAMFNAFMASPPHREQILSPDWRTVGIGTAGGYWTLDFSAYDDSSAPPPPPLRYTARLPLLARAP